MIILVAILAVLLSALLRAVEIHIEYLDDCKTYGKDAADEIQKHYEENGI